jgi:hypothetical protein
MELGMDEIRDAQFWSAAWFRKRNETFKMEIVEMKIFKLAVLFLFLAPMIAFADELPKAKVVTGGMQSAKCISPIHVNSIDGRTVQVPKLGFDLDPGKHSLMGRALIDTSVCRTIGTGSDRYNVDAIEYEFEAGKIYYLGLDHSAPNRNDWKYVVWKVEESKS